MNPALSRFISGTCQILLTLHIVGQVSIAGSRVTLQPVLVLEETYTDNLFLDENQAEEDIVSTVSVGGRAAAENPTSGLEVDYRLGFSRYQRFSENDDIRHEADLKSWWQPSRHSRISMTNGFRVTEEPTEELSDFGPDDDEAQRSEAREVETETIRRTRNRYLENNFDLNYVYEFGPSDRIAVGYRHDLLRNEDPTIRNREIHRPSLNVEYWPLPGRLQALADSTYLREDVENAVGDPGFFEEEIRSNISLVYWILPRQFSLRGGVEYIRGVFWDEALLTGNGQILEREDNWYESLAPSIEFFYRWIPAKMEFEGEVSRQRAVTYGNDNLSDPDDDFETWSGRIAVTRFLSRKLDIIGGYAYASTDFFRDDGENEDYSVHGPSVGFRYRLKEDLPVQLTVGFLERDQEISGRETAVTLNGTLGEWEFYRHATLQFNASSGYTDSNLGAEPLGFGFYYDARLILGYRFHQDWRAEFQGYYRKNRFTDFEDQEEPSGEVRDDRIQEYTAGLSYQMRRWLFFQITYVYRDVNATEVEDSYTENRVTFRVGLSSDRPFRIY
jgi:hypothetical protein